MKYFLTTLLSIILFTSISFGGTKMEIFNLNNGIKVIFKQTKSVEILDEKYVFGDDDFDTGTYEWKKNLK